MQLPREAGFAVGGVERRSVRRIGCERGEESVRRIAMERLR